MMFTTEISHGFTWSRPSSDRSPFEIGLEKFVRELNELNIKGQHAQVQNILMVGAIIHPYVDPILWNKVLRWCDCAQGCGAWMENVGDSSSPNGEIMFE
ncbi:hypothetical protein SUGI_0502980 [Cryptomeria japonica]|nr:hypothetical protein SUGI_0502980 [Cryptomeria japonica]